MHNTVKNLLEIDNNIKVHLNKLNINSTSKIIAVSKTFKIDKILPLIEYGHIDFGENKVQEAIEKWTDIKKINLQIKLHMIGKLQTNKVKYAVRIFDYIHSVDSAKLAKKIADEQNKIQKNLKIFIQVNIGGEHQKTGINKDQIQSFYSYCSELNLDVVGLMCIPPFDKDPNLFFEEMQTLTKKYKFNELSMGMSSDFIEAANYSSTFLRIGSKIFGQRN